AWGIFPGLRVASRNSLDTGVRWYVQPEMGPAPPPEERAPLKTKIISLKGIVLPVVLIVVVLGFIFLGVTSPTEASAMGAVGAIICAAVHRRLNWALIKNSALTTLRISGMTFWIIIMATTFSKVYTGLGAADMIREMMAALMIGRWGVLIIIQLTFFIFGMFLDDFAILFVIMPIYIPIVSSFGFDPVWFAILYVVNMQMAYLTPPYGFNLFYMRAVAPPEITMADIYRSVIPFVALQIIGLAIIMIFPQIVMFLPNLIFGS
ncbi:MAG: TRAP transporter large permease subunit, partial [Dehalococcoidales bacterium]|nr:TRAP transporter large permease subunit [Dehalococcoidales bacterium]